MNLQPLMEYLRHHPQTAIGLTFLIAFIESLPILGTLFPGSVTMTAIGALIGAAVAPPILTCIAAISGAFLGDCLGFWLGNKYHQTIRSVWPLNKMRKYFDYSEKFFAKHGGKSIVIGRFIGPTRAAMPMIAGILRYTWQQFLTAAICAAILWSFVYITPGIILGVLAMEFSPADMTKVFFSGLLLIVALWASFGLLQYFFRRLSRAINHSMQTGWNWLREIKAGIIVRLIGNQQQPEDFHQLKLALLWLIISGLFLLLWFAVSHQGVITRLNEPLFNLMQSFRTPERNQTAVVLTILGTPEALLIASILVAVGLGVYKQWRAAIHLASLGIFSAGVTAVVKKLYFSARPLGLAVVDTSSSFPSGHTLLSVAILGFLAFLTGKIIARGWRGLIYTFFIVLIGLISGSRLFLGQHWFTDVLGSWLLGLSVLLFIMLSYRRLPAPSTLPQIKKSQWLLILLFGAGLPWLAAGWFTFSNTWRDTQPVWPVIQLKVADWWRQPTAAVPLYRRDRFGHVAQPFNVQWLGSLEEIQAFLQQHQWYPLEKQSRMQTTLQRFTRLQPEYNLPLLPWLYQNKPPVLFFIKHLPNSPDILELRLWPSGVQFTDSSRPLWLGILIYHAPPEKILRFPHHYMRLQSGNSLVDLPGPLTGFQFQLVHIDPEQQPERIQKLHWNGDIYILAPAAGIT